MDLNKLYFRHQICLMRISSASSERVRVGYIALAGALGRRIGLFHHRQGASIATMWVGSGSQLSRPSS